MKKYLSTLLTIIIIFTLLLNSEAQSNKTYRVRSGDILAHIARQFDLSLDEIIALNNIKNANSIKIGQILKVSLDDIVILEDAVINPLPSNKDPVKSDHISILKEFRTMLNTLDSADEKTSDDTTAFTGALFTGAQWPTAYPHPIQNITFSTSEVLQGHSFGLNIMLQEAATLRASFVGQGYSFLSNGLTHDTLMAVPVFQKPGIYPLDIEITKADSTIQNLILPISINAGLSERKSIGVLPTTTSRLGQETNRLEANTISKHCTNFDTTRHFDSGFQYPLSQASIHTDFGINRFYAGSPANSIHEGLDFKVKRKTPVSASANGIVRLAQDLTIRGNVVVIDHGMGLCTVYSHLDEFQVAEGDTITKDDVIGTVGATGLVNHTNLHWEIRIMGIPVNPQQWVEEVQVSN